MKDILLSTLEKTLEEQQVIMIITKPELRAPLSYFVVAYLLKKENTQGLYVALNIPYSIVEKRLAKYGVNTKKLFFIDCITASIKSPKEKENVVYLDTPNLKLLEGAMKHSLMNLSGEKNFVYIESVSTLLAYNSYNSFIKFLRNITNEIRLYDLIGIIFMLDRELKEVEFNQIAIFVDDIVDFTGLNKEDLTLN